MNNNNIFYQRNKVRLIEQAKNHEGGKEQAK